VSSNGDSGGEDDFEARLAALKRAKGETPYGEGKKAAPKEKSSSSSSNGETHAQTRKPPSLSFL